MANWLETRLVSKTYHFQANFFLIEKNGQACASVVASEHSSCGASGVFIPRTNVKSKD